MKSFEVRRTIAASPNHIWKIITDSQMLQTSDMGITRLDGAIARNAKIRLWSEVNPDRAFSLKVAELIPNERMVWIGGLPLGLFTGTRQFNLSQVAGGTEFHMHEAFTGPFAGLITKSIPDLQPSFEKFADGLQRLTKGTSQ